MVTMADSKLIPGGAEPIGMVMCIIASFFALFLASGMFQATLSRLDDVELARAETHEYAAKLEILNEDISKVNRELADNFQKLKEAQDDNIRKSKMAQLGTLTAMVAHELRNPLGAVRNSNYLISVKAKNSGLQVEKQIVRIDSAVTRCDHIITQLLNYSHAQELVIESVDLEPWLTDILEQEASHLPDCIAIECELSIIGAKISMDQSKMQRAIANFLTNASQAMTEQDGQPRPDLKRKPKVNVSAVCVNGNLEISVTDNGPGISQENLLRIREPLFTTKSFGPGLGIPTAEQIVQQHGGTLDILSELGIGSTFKIRLPLAKESLSV